MARGIVLFGPAGAGKTELGLLAAGALQMPFFDRDDYTWRKDTPEPFTVRNTPEEETKLLLEALLPNEHFILAGYMRDCPPELEKCIELAVHINAPAEIREKRIRQRELAIYGDRILEGGDMYETHEAFIRMTAKYDSEGEQYLKQHLEWGESLQCPLLKIDGSRPLIGNLEILLAAYKNLKN